MMIAHARPEPIEEPEQAEIPVQKSFEPLPEDYWDEDYDDYYDDEYYDEYDDGYDDGYDAPYDDGRDYYDPPPDYGGYQDDWAPPPDYGQDREPTLYWRRGTPPDPDRDMDFQDTARYRFDQTERRDRR